MMNGLIEREFHGVAIQVKKLKFPESSGLHVDSVTANYVDDVRFT